MKDYYTTEKVMELVDDIEPLREYLYGYPDAICGGFFKKEYVDMYINR